VSTQASSKRSFIQPARETGDGGGARLTPEEKAAEEEKPRSERRRLRVPTSVLLTLLVAVMSVLVGPAFARQWEDRQKARELKAAIADEIASATARTLGAGVYVARAQQAQARRDRFVNARAFWRPASLRIEMKLKAYFPASMADEWKQLVLKIDDFLLNVCARASPPGQPFASDLTASSRRDNIAAWFESSSKLRPLPKILQSLTPSEIAHTATGGDAEDRAYVIEAGEEWMFAETDKMAAVLFDAHPAEFSTGRRDLLRDLVPG
jgi:hypothetical protein